ncbi:MAG: sigma-70 family RNA polymerase sigma factor [Hyphomonadaceae bacterium]
MSSILKEFIANEPAIRKVLSRYFRRAEDVEDLAQEVFVRAFAAERERTIRMPRAYLFQTARNVALNELDRRRNSPAQALEDFPDPHVISIDTRPGPDREFEGRAQLAHFLRAAATLPDQCRRVFLMKKVDGRTQREIAHALGISESTVEKHLARGLLMVRNYLASQDGRDGSRTDGAAVIHEIRRRSGEGE